jgi:7,8-dihydropterin-6-yl-methyl-4-(beta-D-ribofuranosyl)aminobenzene 5'-phosphate synthase
VNAAAHALELGGGAPLYAIMGGFHLADAPPEKMQLTLDDLKNLGPKILIPGHCTGWRFKFKIEQELAGFLVPCFSGNNYRLQSHPHLL